MSRFLVMGKQSGPTPPPNSPEASQFLKLMLSELEYEVKLEKEGKIIAGGPFLDIRGGCYILEVDTVEEMGEILFNSPINAWVERMVHPLGTAEDTLAGMKGRLAAASRRR